MDFSQFITHGCVTLYVCFPDWINEIFVINPMLGQIDICRQDWEHLILEELGCWDLKHPKDQPVLATSWGARQPSEHKGLDIPGVAGGQWDSAATSPEGSHREKAISVPSKPQQHTVREMRGKRATTMILIDPEVMQCFQKCAACLESQNDKVCAISVIKATPYDDYK